MEPRDRENEDGTKPPYRKVIADLRDCEERYHGLLNSISITDEARLTAVESERERIGQDLHDDLCQRLGATAMMTSVIATRIGRNDSQAGVELKKIATLINDTIESCRLLARGLHPVTLAAKGLPAALDELAERMPPGMNFRWPRGVRIALEPATALHLYRITEEAVGNAVKHSGAKNITVELDVLGGRTVLVIEDDGKGFNQDLSSDGMGLRNIHYRAGAIGADLTIGQRKGGGTRIRCRLPRPKARDLDPPRAK